jgi:hypothetical protein
MTCGSFQASRRQALRHSTGRSPPNALCAGWQPTCGLSQCLDQQT